MPIHDWSKVPAGLFHDFHQSWSVRIKDALNAGMLPENVAALVEQRAGTPVPDVLAIEEKLQPVSAEKSNGGALTLERPVTRIIRRSEKLMYAERANRIVIKHHLGRIIAVIEIVSPGNKDSRAALRDFAEKAVDLLRQRIHLLIIDLFPPTSRDPWGVHKVVWDEVEEEDFQFPPGKDRILASYQAGEECVAYVEPIAVGDDLPSMPIFLTREYNVKAPLEATYRATWDASSRALRAAVETGALP